jgi:hypothetical protein
LLGEVTVAEDLRGGALGGGEDGGEREQEGDGLETGQIRPLVGALKGRVSQSWGECEF